MAKSHTVYLLLGGNVPSRSAYLAKGIELISKWVGKILRTCLLYESEPWGFEAPVAFLNQVVCVETRLSPMELLKVTRTIEQSAGRAKKSAGGTYASRTLDVDILFYDEERVLLPDLTVPHARMAERRFTLLPLAEIAPEKIHPVLKKSCLQLLNDCKDEGRVWKYKGKQVHAV